MKLSLIRGLSGSGKTTMAKSFECLHLEMDMFFIRDGVYEFDPSQIKDVAEACIVACETALRFNMDVVVSNTFTRIWEMQTYIDLAKKYDANLKVLKCTGQFQGVHDIPEEHLTLMADRWEDYPGEVPLSVDFLDLVRGGKIITN